MTEQVGVAIPSDELWYAEKVKSNTSSWFAMKHIFV